MTTYRRETPRKSEYRIGWIWSHHYKHLRSHYWARKSSRLWSYSRAEHLWTRIKVSSYNRPPSATHSDRGSPATSWPLRWHIYLWSWWLSIIYHQLYVTITHHPEFIVVQKWDIICADIDHFVFKALRWRPKQQKYFQWNILLYNDSNVTLERVWLSIYFKFWLFRAFYMKPYLQQPC